MQLLIGLCLIRGLLGDPTSAGHLRASARQGAQTQGPIAVIGAGFSGLSAALELKQLGYEVKIYERSNHVGGRGYAWSQNGFTFDAGPSWYWMPEIFDQIFVKHGRRSTDYYNLTRLDPAYSVYFEKGTRTQIPGSFDPFLKWIDSVEPQAKTCVREYFENARTLYDKGIGEWIWKPMVSLTEFIDFELIKSALTMNMFGSLEADITKCVRSPLLQQVLKWPVIFLGASPKEAPAMYSLMTYAGHALGTWYPDGGMSAPSKALAKLAQEEGVEVKLNAKVDKLVIDQGRVESVCANGICDAVAGVVASGDYHHLETHLLPPEYRRYKEDFWDNQVLSPSVLLYYLGVSKTLPLDHHTFFFDDKLDQSLKAAIEDHAMEADPVFYVTSTTKVDPATAPKDNSALFILVPISYKLNGTDTQAVRDTVFDSIIRRMELDIGPFRDSIVYKRDYGPSDFEKEFGAFRGNAFGHANLLEQSLILKPSMDSLLSNMVFTGHLTNPGPGVPPAIASGHTAAHLLVSKLHPGISLIWILNIFAAILLACRLSVSSKMQRSRLACMRLLYNHGRTFFAGASLMKKQEFLDTAALYGMMRIADDCVDDVDDYASRRQRLNDFEGKFWKAWESKDIDASYNDHPVLPAVVEVSWRLKFPRAFFELFFRSMRADIEENICSSMEDAMYYIEGSAAVVGDFMLPILMPDSTKEEIEEARPFAQDLGRAFQLTNFCRDIDEDLDIHRQYIPEDLCKKHGVDLWKRTEKQEGFANLIEEIFTECDRLYVSADKGIALLPERVRPVVLVASRLYQQIQGEVRKRSYNVFESRVRVPTKTKVKIAMQEISFGLTSKMLVAEVALLTVFFLDEVTIPFVVLLGAYQLCEAVTWSGLTYYGFHCLCTLPQLAVLFWYAKSQAESPAYFRMACKWMAVLCGVAVLYSTPWDNYLVASGIWGYGSPSHTLGVIGYVPIEEYAFFVIETLIVGMTWVAHARCGIIPHFQGKSSRNLGFIILGALYLVGCLLLQIDRGRYLGLITVWAMPVLAIQWAFGADALMAQRDSWLKPWLYSWFYLCVIDRWAIRNGCWSINPKYTLPLIDFLPVEEAYFFACTVTMCLWGLQLAMNVDVLDCARSVAYQRVLHWCRKLPNLKPIAWTMEMKHTVGAIGLSMLIMFFARNLSMSWQVMVLVFTTAVFGLPHGALDMIVADWLQLKKVRFMQLYLATMGAVVLAWFALPRVTLTVFILMSVYHFGERDTAGNAANISIDVLARGGMILLPIKVHAADTMTIFSSLVGGLDLEPVMFVLDFAVQLHMSALIVSLAYHALKSHAFEHLLIFLECATLSLVFYTMPPLMSFVVYFNIFHSARHLVRLGNSGISKRAQTAVGCKRMETQAIMTFGVTLITISALVACFIADTYMKVQGPGKAFQVDMIGPALRAVFIGLSALTSPHMIVVSVLLKLPLFRREVHVFGLA
eukprot:TRINITY_DN27047_c0_g1_i1.p1 TRINITY_DN27047_c0_g1~~TRINITY_DN27047_c0_g1_i1.p1  ORF type:complete len:1456 (-),score=289.68 TRINITY_DN27047_c0_g1_i1:198-4565(-)